VLSHTQNDKVRVGTQSMNKLVTRVRTMNKLITIENKQHYE